MSIVRNENLWQSGKNKIDWVRDCMPVLATIEKRFKEEKPLAGLRLSMSIHLEAKTAYLAMVLAAGGAESGLSECGEASLCLPSHGACGGDV